MAKPHKPRKRFGQNFLQDNQVIEHIIKALHPKFDDNIVEIGPGQGAITKELVKDVDKLHVIEIDKDLIAELPGRCQPNTNIIIHESDVLKFDFHQLATDEKKLRIVGNLPYNITTPLLFHLLKSPDIIQDMIFMLQKEVVNRLGATPGGRHYGRLTVMIQYHCVVEPLFDVPPQAFYPPPKVNSAMVRLTPHSALPSTAKEYSLFETIVRDAFNQRRKTLRNALKKHMTEDDLKELGIDPQVRPEQLSISDFVKITNCISVANDI